MILFTWAGRFHYNIMHYTYRGFVTVGDGDGEIFITGAITVRPTVGLRVIN